MKEQVGLTREREPEGGHEEVWGKEVEGGSG